MIDIYPSRYALEPEVLPRKDAVVHQQWYKDAPLTVAQTKQFDQDGYLVLENLFSDAEVATLQCATAALLADPRSLNAETVVTEAGSREVRSIFDIHQQNDIMARLAADSRIADVARFLLDDEVYIHQSRLNYKPGFKGREFYWHSDFETWHIEDGMPQMRALSVSILLAENTPHNGPLMVIPRSHHHYLTCIGETPPDHYLNSLKRQEYGVPDEDNLAELAHNYGIVAPTGKPGTAILFDCNLMHGSNGNITPFPRANAFLVYNAIGNRLEKPFGVDKPRPWFLAHRGEPDPIAVQYGSIKELPAS
ncbi:MAG TPA: ectoine hydroxylase [Sphingopyxis sp.]|nr:ectoine hydroxylase [Sphingopyxis sp.]